jgi:histidinol-phosphatase (PHP family)
MAIKINFHMHSTGSDGNISPEEVIKESIAQGIHFMCFTDHYPAPGNIDPFASEFYTEKHYNQLVSLKKKYKSDIDISIGAEFDWAEGFNQWYQKEIEKRKYDYLIGSVHRVIINKENFGFWDDPIKTKEFLDRVGKKNYVQAYFESMRNMIKSGIFDGVGHLDIIKLNNNRYNLFSEKDDWYRIEIIKTLDILKESKMVMEINMRGEAKHGPDGQYPSFWIIKEAKKRNIPITIGNDFHNLKYGPIDNLLQEALSLARQAGYSEIVRFKARKMISIEI